MLLKLTPEDPNVLACEQHVVVAPGLVSGVHQVFTTPPQRQTTLNFHFTYCSSMKVAKPTNTSHNKRKV